MRFVATPDRAGREADYIVANAFLLASKGKGSRHRDHPQALSHFLAFKDQAVADTCLPCCIAQVITLPTSPGVAAGANSGSTLRPHRHTKKGRRPPKRHPTQVTGSIWRSSVIAASFNAWVGRLRKRACWCVKLIALSLADVRCFAQVTDVDASCLLDGFGRIYEFAATLGCGRSFLWIWRDGAAICSSRILNRVDAIPIPLALRCSSKGRYSTFHYSVQAAG